MDNLGKLSDAMLLNGEKRASLRGALDLLMMESKDWERHLKSAETCLRECLSEHKIKEDVRRQKLCFEKGLKNLEEKETVLNGLLEKIDMERKQFGVQIQGSVDEKLKEIAVREQYLVDVLEKKENELRCLKECLDKMKDELASSRESLETRKNGVASSEEYLQKREIQLKSKEILLKEKEMDLISREETVRNKEISIESRDKTMTDLRSSLELREKVLKKDEAKVDSTKKSLEKQAKELESLKKDMEKTKKELISKEDDLETRKAELTGLAREIELERELVQLKETELATRQQLLELRGKNRKADSVIDSQKECSELVEHDLAKHHEPVTTILARTPKVCGTKIVEGNNSSGSSKRKRSSRSVIRLIKGLAAKEKHQLI